MGETPSPIVAPHTPSATSRAGSLSMTVSAYYGDHFSPGGIKLNGVVSRLKVVAFR